MSVAARAEALARAGRGLEARALIEDAAFRGDGVALLMMAFWRLYGVNGPRDWVDMHRLLDRAIAGGHTPALTLKATLTANGTGVPADWAAAMRLLAKAAKRDAPAKAQLDLLKTQDAVEDAGTGRALPAPQRLADSPDAVLYPGLVRPAECRWLIAAATPEIRPAAPLEWMINRFLVGSERGYAQPLVPIQSFRHRHRPSGPHRLREFGPGPTMDFLHLADRPLLDHSRCGPVFAAALDLVPHLGHNPGFGGGEALAEGFESGAVMYINKPFTANKLLTIVNTMRHTRFSAGQKFAPAVRS